jgi:hypothetical protein
MLIKTSAEGYIKRMQGAVLQHVSPAVVSLLTIAGIASKEVAAHPGLPGSQKTCCDPDTQKIRNESTPASEPSLTMMRAIWKRCVHAPVRSAYSLRTKHFKGIHAR